MPEATLPFPDLEFGILEKFCGNEIIKKALQAPSTEKEKKKNICPNISSQPFHEEGFGTVLRIFHFSLSIYDYQRAVSLVLSLSLPALYSQQRTILGGGQGGKN